MKPWFIPIVFVLSMIITWQILDIIWMLAERAASCS